MGYRIGTKVGKKSYVSVGKSGTYASTWIGGFKVSKFTPSKRSSKKADVKESSSYSSLTEEEEIPMSLFIGLMVISSLAFLGLVYLTSLFYIPLGIALSINLIGTHLIWRKVESEDKWVYYLFPLLSIFSVAGIVIWSLLLITSWILILI